MSKGYVSEIFRSFQGEGLFAGQRHLFVRMAGCNLRCGYCDTPESLERTPGCTIYENDSAGREIANPLSGAELATLLRPFLSAANGLRALAITGGEPLVQADFLADWLGGNPPPLDVLLETNGTYPDRLLRVLPFLRIVSMDVKLPSSSGERPFWDEHRRFLDACRGKTVYVKVPVDETTADEEVQEAARLVADFDRRAVFFLQPIVSPEVELRVTPARLERFYDLAAEHLDDVRVLPQTHKFLGIR